MGISEEIEIIVNALTDNNIPSQIVSIIRTYPTNTCDIKTNNGVYRNVRCSGKADNDKHGLLLFEDGKQDKPFVLLFNDLKDYYTKEEIDDLISGGGADLKRYVKKEELNSILSSYVTIDFANSTYALKSELFSGSYDDLTNKPSIPSKTSELTNDSGFLTQHQSLEDYYTKTESNNLLDTKVDKVTGKGLSTEDFTSAEKTKLNNIEAQANRTIVDSALDRSSTNPVQNQAIANAFENMHIKVVNSLPEPSSNYSNDLYVVVGGSSAVNGLYICEYIPQSTDDDVLGYGEWKWTPLTKTIGFDEIYPVGAIYISVNSTNPTNLFGGTWVQLTETFLYASTTADANNTTATGGEATHTLTINEMPSHNHAQQKHNHSMGENWSSGSGSTSAIVNSSNRSRTERFTDFQAPTIGNTGGGQAHNNMPPYMKVYMWKRTA